MGAPPTALQLTNLGQKCWQTTIFGWEGGGGGGGGGCKKTQLVKS
jgi:hypothetical protein